LKRGLVIGKFMPIHAGHIALINFARQKCDELIVSMSYTPTDAIPHEERFQWIVKIFEHDPKIIPRLIPDNFDQPELPLPERTLIWADVLTEVYPKIDVVFSSEEYGAQLAKHFGAVNVIFDIDRKFLPISASMIRQNPFANWSFIPKIVRPYFVKKICFYGAESTGKSVMATQMAEKYKTVFVPEVAREMLTTNNFTTADIILIGQAHYERILQAEKIANKIIFCDTDAITTQVYSNYYLNEVPAILFDLEQKIKYDHYFFFDIDVPWVADGLRDLSHKREEMFNLFKSELERRHIAYTLVKGNWDERESIITKKVDELLQLR
jgi:HTH-type transcriptional regulator, transcriptional repressor of NAD biosynthesis genes